MKTIRTVVRSRQDEKTQPVFLNVMTSEDFKMIDKLLSLHTEELRTDCEHIGRLVSICKMLTEQVFALRKEVESLKKHLADEQDTESTYIK